VESDVGSAPVSILNAEHWLNCGGYLDNQTASEDDCEADVESDMELDNGMEDTESPDLRDVSATPNVPGLIRPTQKSKNMAE